MGLFLAMSGVIGKSYDEVVGSLQKYSQSVGGGLEAAPLKSDDDNCCIVATDAGNTTIFYPSGYIEWYESSAFISGDLKAPVFSLHVHDGDLWMYVLYVDGKVVDQFNPIPDYWEENISEEERENWKGNAETVSRYIQGLDARDIDKYLVSWAIDAEVGIKAYESDEYPQEDWQLLDFMRKLKLPYPLDDDLKATGKTFRFWTRELRLQQHKTNALKKPQIVHTPKTQKPWWRFW